MARSGPFIMPDGKPLGAFLDGSGSRAGADTSTRKRGKKGRSSGNQRWERGFPAAAAAAQMSAGDSEAETWELDAISRVGRERRRRWLNDKILRDMAGALTAPEMQNLFAPPPFGGPSARPSVISEVLLPSNVAVWDLFRNIDADMQTRVLQRWEQHVAQHQGADAAGQSVSPALRALQAWAGTSRKARDALRRASTVVVHALETRIMRLRTSSGLPLNTGPTAQFDALSEPSAAAAMPGGSSSSNPVSGDIAPDGCAAPVGSGQDAAAAPASAADPTSSGAEPGGNGDSSRTKAAGSSRDRTAVEIPSLRLQSASAQPAHQQQELRLRLETGFGRLLVHGLAQFHGLASFSRDALHAQDAATSEQLPMEMELLSESPAAEGTSPRITVVRRLSQGQSADVALDDIITVSDILLVMDQQAGSGRSLTASMLDIPGTPVSVEYGPPQQ